MMRYFKPMWGFQWYLIVYCGARLLQCKNLANRIYRLLTLPCNKANSPVLQGRDIRNPQICGLTKGVLFYCTVCKICQKVR